MPIVARLSVLVLAAACTPAPPALAESGRDAVEQEVRAAAVALGAALIQGDPDSILTFYRLDEEFTHVGCTRSVRGGSPFAAMVTQYHRQNPEVAHRYEVMAVRILGPDAAVASLQGVSGDVELFITRAMERGDNGQWTIVHEHESWPGCSLPAPPHPGAVPGIGWVPPPDVQGS